MNVMDMFCELGKGLAVSIAIFACTLLLSLPLALPIACARLSKNPILSGLASVYLSIMRGTPLMLQIIFIYFAPYLLFHCSLEHYPRFVATVLAFSLNYAAYFAEIYRGGIQSVDVGQIEAGRALALSTRQVFYRITIPQMFKIVLPAIGNEAITLVKDTSLAFTIAVTEMFTIARQISSDHTSMIPLVTAGLFYWLFNAFVAKGISAVERKLNYYK